MTRVVVHFRYTKGMLVTVGSDTSTVYRILRRRYTERQIMGPLHEYGLEPIAYVHGPLIWEMEPDLHPAEEAQ